VKECKVKNQKNIKLDEDKQIGYAMPLEILDPLVRILKLQSIETHDAELVAEEQQAQLEIREAFAELEADVSRLQSFCKTEYDNGLSDGLFNEEQERIEKNKKIQIQDAIINSLKQTIADLQKENLRLENEASRIDELEAEVKRFQLACRTAYNDGIAEGEKERLKLGGEIERMKCCGNCKHEPEFFSDNGCCVMCAKLDKWEEK